MKVLWTDPARNDLQEAMEFIGGKNPQAARGIAQKIYRASRKIHDFNALGKPGKLEDTREFLIPSTNYIMVYRVKSNHLEILRLLHHKQLWP